MNENIPKIVETKSSNLTIRENIHKKTHFLSTERFQFWRKHQIIRHSFFKTFEEILNVSVRTKSFKITLLH